MGKCTEGRVEKLEQKLSSEMNFVNKQLNETFVERNAAHEHTANDIELETQKSNAKSKKEMVNLLIQFDSVLSVEIVRMGPQNVRWSKSRRA